MFEGKRALVTGAASGIGLGTARALVEAGASVILADVSDELGEREAAALGATYVHLDVSSSEAWDALVSELEGLDLLHLNAGIYFDAEEWDDITAITDAQYRRFLGVNVDGVFFGLRAAIPLLEQSHGAVVVTSSLAGVMPLPTHPVYSLTKHALIGLVRSVADNLASRGIRINALCPGAVATPLNGPDPYAKFAARGITPLEPSDLAVTTLELFASDRSGEVILHRPGQSVAPVDFPRFSSLRAT